MMEFKDLLRMEGLYLFASLLVVHQAYSLVFKARKLRTTNTFYADSGEAEAAYSKTVGNKQKSFAYGTVIYVPPSNVAIDFGSAKVWPPAFHKKDSSPRVLLVSTWTTAKLALVGGRAKNKGDETPVQVMNREFAEETGCSTVVFSPSDHVCSKIEDKLVAVGKPSNLKLSHFFVKITHDEAEFNAILTAFYGDRRRKGFVDEIFATVGMPLWLEGPARPADICWEDNCWGLPRLLIGGAFREREDLAVLLMAAKGVASKAVMRRAFDLAHAIEAQQRTETVGRRVTAWLEGVFGESRALPTFDALLAAPGLASIL